VRQWVLSVPKRLRYFLERSPCAASAVLHILLRVVEAHLRKRSPGASPRARCGAVSFVHRFGAALNGHLHDHCCILDGVFELLEAGGVQFRQASALAPEEVAASDTSARRKGDRMSWESPRSAHDSIAATEKSCVFHAKVDTDSTASWTPEIARRGAG
jgi:hypothetical protein